MRAARRLLSRSIPPILLVALVLIALASLRALAFAGLPDRSWIPGISGTTGPDHLVTLVVETHEAGPSGRIEPEPPYLLTERVWDRSSTADLAVPVAPGPPRAPPSS